MNPHNGPDRTEPEAPATRWGAGAVLAALSDAGAVAPPEAARLGVLQHAQRSTPRAVMLSAGEAYSELASTFGDVVGRLGRADWERRAEPYDWSVHALVAHLTVIERYTAHALGITHPMLEPLRADDLIDEPHHLRLGQLDIARELRCDPLETARRWSAASSAVADAVRDYGPAELACPAPMHGWPFTRETSLIARAFELWTHGEDVCRAAGRSTVRPSDGALAVMSSTVVKSLEVLAGAAIAEAPGSRLRIVLTGPGGGTYDLGAPVPSVAHAAQAPVQRSLIVADVVDYCRVAARRMDGADAVTEQRCDSQLASAVFHASSRFAV